MVHPVQFQVLNILLVVVEVQVTKQVFLVEQAEQVVEVQDKEGQVVRLV